MKSKGERFAKSKSAKVTASEPGPGEYDSHTHKTIQTFLTDSHKKMNRQNPGFGASSAAHVLPYEVEIANDLKPYVKHAGPHAVTGGYQSGGSFSNGVSSSAKKEHGP
jgi:hypothetical protein